MSEQEVFDEPDHTVYIRASDLTPLRVHRAITYLRHRIEQGLLGPAYESLALQCRYDILHRAIGSINSVTDGEPLENVLQGGASKHSCHIFVAFRQGALGEADKIAEDLSGDDCLEDCATGKIGNRLNREHR